MQNCRSSNSSIDVHNGNGVTIVNVGYRSTNVWVVSASRSRLMVDLGWPGMLGPLLATLMRKDVPLEEIGYGAATHCRIDHAGRAQEDLRVVARRWQWLRESGATTVYGGAVRRGCLRPRHSWSVPPLAQS